MIEPAFVATKTLTSNELPPHPLRNWIITAFCKRMASEYPFAGQNHTFYSAVLFKCLDGVLRARRRVLAVRSCHRGNIELISPNHLYQDLLNQGGVTVIDFWAPWCGYCVRMMPIIEEIAGELEGKANFVKVNADEEPELARNMQVEVLHTFVILKDGEVVDRKIGFLPKGDLQGAIESKF